jgi:hypothetical protein
VQLNAMGPISPGGFAARTKKLPSTKPGFVRQCRCAGRWGRFEEFSVLRMYVRMACLLKIANLDSSPVSLSL